MVHSSINFREARDGLWDEVRAKAVLEEMTGSDVINRALLDYVLDEDDPAALARRIAADAWRLAAIRDA